MNRSLPAAFRSVAVVSPAGRLAQESLSSGIAALRELGAAVRDFSPKATDKVPEYLAGTDADRAAGLTAAWLDPETQWLLAARGGYGCTRLLHMLDWEQLAAHPQVLAGYSDLTALHFAMTKRRAGTPVAGPMLNHAAAWDDFTLEQLCAALECRPRTVAHLEMLNAGDACGLPLAGNLTVAASLCGTPYLPDAAGRIVILEDVGERAYKLDRMLTQLRDSGFFTGAAAVLFGYFSDCPGHEALLRDFAAELHCPAGCGVPFGHELPQASFNFSQPLALQNGILRAL